MPGSGAGEWGEGHAVVYFVRTGGKCTQMINSVQCHHLLQEDTPKLDKRQGRLYGWVFKECWVTFPTKLACFSMRSPFYCQWYSQGWEPEPSRKEGRIWA